MSARAGTSGERLVRTRVRVEGTVQGVGFRPYVYRLAHELGLGGHVLNDAQGVLIEAEGGAGAVDRFLARLGSEAPPLAIVERVVSSPIAPTGEAGFRIHDSPRGEPANAPVTPDSATCPDCLCEVHDPDDRRFRYPFINCTNCGPRFTIVRGIPYDRPFTTMAGFEMCVSCRAEYEDPGDRRFHAQPNACPRCGPTVSLLGADGSSVQWGEDRDAVAAAARALRQGSILAIKGLGGYHLACLADDEPAVARLRARKHREDKPFALMARDIMSARGLIELGEAEERLLDSPARPIVLATRLAQAPVAPSVAPGAPELGVMLPYAPLHHLLLDDTGTNLVMTSGNLSDEPIAYRDEDALARLAGIADLLVVHDRPIETRTDDSVVRVVAASGSRRTAFLRRSRGFVPASLLLAGDGARRQVLACGAELKNTFCLAKGRRAWVSHHIGDLENFETLSSFVEGIEHFKRLFELEPEVVAYDLHPEYLSTKYALEQEDVELLGVQHHHAHLAACLAEHGVEGPAVGAIFDGTGYGVDGTIWGGELLVGDLEGFERAGHLWPLRMPGGAAAIREPWRMACAWLDEAFEEAQPVPAALSGRVDEQRWRAVGRLAASAGLSPLTTSMGRLFDAVAALCGVREQINYEGQAAIELEALATGASPHAGYELAVIDGHDGTVLLDPRETLRAIGRDLAGGGVPQAVAAGFHGAVAKATARACAEIASRRGLGDVVLSGGVFQNRLLLDASARALRDAGLRVLIPELLPLGDGGISYGQAAVAAARERFGGAR